jgi:autotransporter-associated beta strand protein
MKKNLFRRAMTTAMLLLAVTFGTYAVNWSGTVNLTNGENIAANITLTGNVTVNVASGAATISGKISGSYKLTKTGAGALYFTADNTYSGGTAIDAGALWFGYNTTTGSVAGNVVINNGAGLGFYHSNEYSYSGVISGNGYIFKWGAKVTLTGKNTFTGKTDINGGTLALGATGTIANSDYVDLYGATSKFDISAGSKQIKGLHGANANAEVILGTKTLTIGTSGGSDGGGTYAGKITGTAPAHFEAIVKRGSATLTLTGTTSTYTGMTCMYGGVLNFSSLANFGNSTLYCSLGTLQWASGNTADISSRLEGNKIVSNFTFDTGANNVTFATAITGSNMFTKKGTGTLRLTADNTATGVTTVSAGYLTIGNAGTTGAVAGNISLAAGTVLSFSRTNRYTCNGKISGAGSIGKYLDGELILGGVNDYTGRTTVEGGKLTLSSTGTIEGSSSIELTNATSKFDISAGTKTIKSLRSSKATAEVILGAKTLTVNETGTQTFAGKISGDNGRITKAGTGALTLSGTNTATGELLLSAGTLSLSSNWAGNLTQFSGTALNVNGYINIGKLLSLQGGTINMNLTTATPSRLIVSGSLSTNGKTALNVTSSNPCNRALLTATDGGVSTMPFTLNTTGTLSATATTLSFALGSSPSLYGRDMPPTVSNKTITAGTVTENSIDISWTKATDDVTAANELDYIVSWRKIAEMTWTHNGLYSEYDYNSTETSAWQTIYLSNSDTWTIPGLQENKEYEVGVEVRDKTGNSTSYRTIKVKTQVDFTDPVMSVFFTVARKNSVEVEWYKATDNRTDSDNLRYQVWCLKEDIGWGDGWSSPIVSGMVSDTSCVVSGLNKDTRYTVVVYVYDEAGNIGIRYASIKTKKDDDVSPQISNEDITLGTITASSIALSWTKATDDKTKQSELRYGVLWNKSEINNYWYSSPLLTDASSYTITGLAANTVYSITIEVYDKDGNVSEYNIVTTKTSLAKTKMLSGTMSTAIEQVEAVDLKVWAHGGTLNISAREPGTACIYNAGGTLVKTAAYSAGETTVPLPQGLYIVRTTEKVFKVTIK